MTGFIMIAMCYDKGTLKILERSKNMANGPFVDAAAEFEAAIASILEINGSVWGIRALF